MKNIKVIYLAGGCFWGTEAYFKSLKGIKKTVVGYANGKSDNTNYEEVAQTDHAETVKIYYDFSRISLTEILLHYFRIIDPKSINRQGNDVGRQYRTGIYWEENDIKSEKIIKDFMTYEEEKLGKLAVEISPIKNFVKNLKKLVKSFILWKDYKIFTTCKWFVLSFYKTSITSIRFLF